jgi:hypothetical protein
VDGPLTQDDFNFFSTFECSTYLSSEGGSVEALCIKLIISIKLFELVGLGFSQISYHFGGYPK